MNPQELLKVVTAESEDVSLTAVFHRLNSVLPENQRMVKVTPETKASEALEVMRRQWVFATTSDRGKRGPRTVLLPVICSRGSRVAAEADNRPTSSLDLTVDEWSKRLSSLGLPTNSAVGLTPSIPTMLLSWVNRIDCWGL